MSRGLAARQRQIGCAKRQLVLPSAQSMVLIRIDDTDPSLGALLTKADDAKWDPKHVVVRQLFLSGFGSRESCEQARAKLEQSDENADREARQTAAASLGDSQQELAHEIDAARHELDVQFPNGQPVTSHDATKRIVWDNLQQRLQGLEAMQQALRKRAASPAAPEPGLHVLECSPSGEPMMRRIEGLLKG